MLQIEQSGREKNTRLGMLMIMGDKPQPDTSTEQEKKDEDQSELRKRFRERRREPGSWELSEEIRSNVGKVRAFVEARELKTTDAEARYLLNAAKKELLNAENILTFARHHRAHMSSHANAAQIHINAARLLWMKSFVNEPESIGAYLPGLKSVIEEHLPAHDARCKAVKLITEIKENDKWKLVVLTEAVEAAQSEALREKMRAASFVHMVCGVAGFLMALAVGVAVLSAFWPDAVPMCFNPIKPPDATLTPSTSTHYTVVCSIQSNDSPNSSDLDTNFKAVATWGDYIVVETVGLVAAGVAAASALRKVRGTSTPYPIPIALALLKLPAGALTAVLGLLLMRGGFVPGLSALDTSAQIIAWAIIFGYSQELFTKFVDKQGQTVLDAVRGPSNPILGDWAVSEKEEAAGKKSEKG